MFHSLKFYWFNVIVVRKLHTQKRAPFCPHPESLCQRVRRAMASSRTLLTPTCTPATTLLPGTRWSTSRQLLKDVMNEFQLSPERHFLLKDDPLSDARAFSSPQLLVHAVPYTSQYWTESPNSADFNSTGERLTGLMVPHCPMQNDQEVVTGVLVDLYMEGTQAKRFVRLPKRVHRVVANKRTRTNVSVSVDPDVSTLELSISILTNNSRLLYAMLVVDRALFLSTFARAPETIKLENLELAVRSSVVAVAQLADPLSEQVLANYGFATTLSIGDCYCKNVFTTYNNGTPVFSMPAYTCATTTSGAQYGVVENMIAWATRDRLSRVAPIVHCAVAPIVESSSVGDSNQELLIGAHEIDKAIGCSSELENAATNPNVQNEERSRSGPRTSDADGTVIIAPAKLTRSSSSEDKLSYAQLADLEKRERLERRRIRNREAAARSNARRSALRKIARLQREQQNKLN